MAKCKRCGRKGLFFKVNSDGLCVNCEATVCAEKEQKQIREETDKIKAELSNEQALRDKIASEVKEKTLHNIQQQIDEYNAKLQTCMQTLVVKILELQATQKKEEKAQKSWALISKKTEIIKNQYEGMKYAINTYSKNSAESQNFSVPPEISNLNESLEPTVKLKFHSVDLKDLRWKYKQNEKQFENVFIKYDGRYTTKTNEAIYKLMTIALRAELQNVLYNLSYGKLDDAESSIKSITAKYLRIATEGNQSIAPTLTKFIAEIEYYFLQAVHIEYEYFTRREKAKEEQKALREQMRQEAAEKRELEQQRKQVEKEESKYTVEMENVQKQIQSSTDNIKITQLQERLNELQSQLSAVKDKKASIVNLQNGMAGYVYVISNLGSFGEDVFKIGMTRRLEPQERIDELGSASVPFPFDVHSFIFSQNAVELEHKIHVLLNDRRVNKINLRKEFFKVSLDELEQLVNSLDPSAEFNRTMLAEQYRQSLSVDKVPEDFESDSDEDDNAEDSSIA